MSSARKFWSYQCEWDGCNRSFKGISNFEAHYRRHTDQRPYVCDYGSCGEAFHDRGSLNRHHCIHANERPFACKYESCSQAFPDSETLDHHYRTHTDQLPFICRYDSCGQAFHDREGLTEHHRTHRLRPLACEYDSCSRTFTRKENLEAHMHMHTRERAFHCSRKSCEKSFCNHTDLVHHENGHTNKDSHPSAFKSPDPTLSEASQLHHHHREEHEKTATSVQETRPIRLRLSQPKRQISGSLEDKPRKRILLRPPTKKTLDDSSTSKPKETRSPCSESKITAKRSTSSIERSKVHQDACSSKPSLSNSFTSAASGEKQVFYHTSKLTLRAEPQIPTLNVRSRAPASQPAVTSRSAEDDSHNAYTNKESGVHRTPVYTRVCGVYSMEQAFPEKAENRRGNYRCPRCDTQFTRPRGVLRHFVGCITKYGNPDSLKWTDHPSLQNTVKPHARNGYQGQQSDLPSQAVEAKKMFCENPKDATLRSLMPKPLSSRDENNMGSTDPACKPSGRDALLEKDLVKPIRKRRDALRPSKYNPETIARDVLLATGSHPDMDPLNAHLDILRRRFRAVTLESNMSTFRWDLVDPEQHSEQNTEQSSRRKCEREVRGEAEYEAEPERQVGQEVEPEQSFPKAPKAQKDMMKSNLNDFELHHTSPFSLPSRSSTKPSFLNNDASFWVNLPEQGHFGSMSTIFSNVFDRDPSAKLMSSNKDLWAAIFTMLEYRYDRENFLIRAAFGNHTGDVIGWAACHEVDTLGAMPEDPLAYLDWTTAAHLLPPQLSRFTSTRENAKEKAERLDQRKVGRFLASTIQARATEAQTHLVPVRRLIINALVVHPLHQGRGVASALLKSITEIMDQQKRPIWIQAPEDPAITQGALNIGLFRRAGFTCAGELNLDLDSYASKGRERSKGKGISFGTYKWNYMLRWPQPVRPNPLRRRSSELHVSG